MGLISFTPSVGSEFEGELTTQELQDTLSGYLVRPCERYRELYSDCSSLRARVHQYYVFGDLTDCSQHSNNYDSCLNYRKTKDPQLLQPIIDWEKNLIQKRLDVAAANPCWDAREIPPSNFNGPLPSFVEERHKKSYFKKL